MIKEYGFSFLENNNPKKVLISTSFEKHHEQVLELQRMTQANTNLVLVRVPFNGKTLHRAKTPRTNLATNHKNTWSQKEY